MYLFIMFYNFVSKVNSNRDMYSGFCPPTQPNPPSQLSDFDL